MTAHDELRACSQKRLMKPCDRAQVGSFLLTCGSVCSVMLDVRMDLTNGVDQRGDDVCVPA